MLCIAYTLSATSSIVTDDSYLFALKKSCRRLLAGVAAPNAYGSEPFCSSSPSRRPMCGSVNATYVSEPTAAASSASVVASTVPDNDGADGDGGSTGGEGGRCGAGGSGGEEGGGDCVARRTPQRSEAQPIQALGMIFT